MAAKPSSTNESPRAESLRVVHPLGFAGTDADLARALGRGHPGAAAALYKRHSDHVRKIIARVLGVDAELEDVVQETFIQALGSVSNLKDPERLRPWLSSVAVFTARGWIRRRQRHRWLSFRGPRDLHKVADSSPKPPNDALRRTYQLLDKLPTDERIAFALRTLGGLELVEVAEACQVSLATIKRRIRKARERFEKLARLDPVLSEYVSER